MIHVTCKMCGHRYRLKEERKSDRIVCKNCGQRIFVERPSRKDSSKGSGSMRMSGTPTRRPSASIKTMVVVVAVLLLLGAAFFAVA
ncbi:MAG TPA: hypothetical protein ENK43_06300 [Planctomycetes bacterium]|nr:hypothetical protein [Planctomycetota bacterium]